MNASFPVDENLMVRLLMTLVHFLWQGCAVAALAVAAGWMLRRSSAHARYLVNVAALTLMTASLPVTFFLVSVPPIASDSDFMNAKRSVSGPSNSDMPSEASPTIAETGDPSAEPVAVTGPTESVSRPGAHRPAAIPPQRLAERLKPVAPYATVAYLLGVVIMLLRFVRALTKAHRLRIGAQPVAEQMLLAMIDRQSRRMGLRGVPAVAWCRRISIPVVVGILRPVVLLPAVVATGLTPDQIEALLTHELAHIRRHDLWINLFQRVTEAILFFHPAVWYVSRRVSIERERACDDSVVSAGWRGMDYAETLVRMAELCLAGRPALSNGTVWLAASGDSPTQFKLRIMRLLGGDVRPQPAMPRKATLVLLTLATVALLLPALMNTRAQPPDAPLEAISESTADNSAEPPADVERSVRRAVSYLESQQRDDGSWQINGFPSHDRGGTALAALALLQSGRTADDKSVQRAAEHLRYVHSSFTYTVALQTLFYCSLDPQKYRLLIQRNVRWLADTQTTAGPAKGGWSYGPQRSCRSDGSNTRFAAWALDAARQTGIDVPQTTWKNLASYWLSSQREDGSWSYTSELPDGTASMTLAGIACLTTVKSAVDEAELHAEIKRSVTRAWKWHDFSFSASGRIRESDSFRFYTLHCLAAAGWCSEHRGTGETDWYTQGSHLLLKMQDSETGAWIGPPAEDRVVATSFALLFLNRPEPIRLASDERLVVDVTDSTTEEPVSDVPVAARNSFSNPEKAADTTTESPRPTLSVELRTERPAQIGEYIVRLIYKNAPFVSEESLQSGNRFDKEFLEREKGRVGRLLIDVPGFAPVTTPEFTVGTDMEPLKINLEPAVYVPIRGQAVDASGKPLSGVRVRVRRIFQGSSTRFPWGAEAATDAEGRFLLEHLRVGEQVAIHVAKEGLGENETDPFLVKSTEAIELPPLRILLADQEVSGVVTDQDGLPVPAAEVAFTGQPPAATKTDIEGRFRLTGLPPGRLLLSLTAPDKSSTQRHAIAGTSNVRLFLPLRTLYNHVEFQLAVTLRTADGETPEDAKYYVIDHTAQGWKQSGGFSGKSKREIDLHTPIRRTPDHKLGLIVFADGYAVTDPIEIVTKPQVEPIVIDLQPAPMSTLRGRIVDAAGKPVAGAAIGVSLSLAEDVVVESWRYVSNMPTEPPVTDARGRFSLPGLHSGTRIAVYTNADGRAGAWSDRVTIDGTSDVTLPDLQLLPATRQIQGRVTDIEGQPITGARVRVHNFSRRETRTDADGRFELAGVADGDLTLAAGAAGYDNTAQQFTTAEIDRGVVLQLRPDPDQFPAAGD